jgi:hypothetical protein
MRAHPSDVGPDGQVTAEAVTNYRKAQIAIHDVRRSVQRFVIIDETNQPVDLRGNSIQGRLPSDPYHLLEDYQKMHLGDFWRVLRNRPSTSLLRSSNFDVEYIPNNSYSFYQVKKLYRKLRGFRSNRTATGMSFQQRISQTISCIRSANIGHQCHMTLTLLTTTILLV